MIFTELILFLHTFVNLNVYTKLFDHLIIMNIWIQVDSVEQHFFNLLVKKNHFFETILIKKNL